MPSNEEEIQHLREIERSIVNDLQNANQILEIVKVESRNNLLLQLPHFSIQFRRSTTKIFIKMFDLLLFIA